ncbi:unnamed protein product [Bursaphelenchus okinawaensis]|uniref:Phospholipid/glycerol acyltransferase domain-containing protein n=1 Tax=Bursaphelenchus okinawaensis TaxID=465554 RepID=A0A811KWI6_9BILA|nr:unnamed protein product [Bursaphelenchus okinawaensis]CAG9112903.1 unnamed protein product [Bursaphelenchus okinawaensis]
MSLPDWVQPHFNNTITWIDHTLQNIDWDYMEYLFWVFLPVFIVFILPVLLLFFIYGCAIFLHIYGWRHRIIEAYASSYWDGARTSIASFWDGVGWIWHGYEVRGMENIPKHGPALFVAYHGTLPLDIYYLIARVLLEQKRQLHVVGDKFVFKIPGWGRICKVFCVTPGTVEDCVACLKEGCLQIIAPGGVREALFSNPVTYKVMWAKRLGFAKVVQGAKVPVIPVFTENCRDAFRTPRWGRKLFRGLYEKSRLPLCPIYGGFPVKMITYLGEPVSFDESYTPEEIKMVVKEKVENLIQTYQRLPGSVIAAMWQRFQGKKEYRRFPKIATNIRSSRGSVEEETLPLTERSFPSTVRNRETSRIDDLLNESATSNSLEEDSIRFPIDEKEDADLSEFSEALHH